MSSRDVYVCDADCLINLHRHFERKAISGLRRSTRSGKVKLPEGVAREILRGTDKLAEFVEREERTAVVKVSDLSGLRAEISRLERRYGEKIVFGKQHYSGFWKSKAGMQAADSQVVGVTKLLGGVAVSDDRSVKLVCALENVPCIGWSELARRLGLSNPQQLELNLGDTGAMHETKDPLA